MKQKKKPKWQERGGMMTHWKRRQVGEPVECTDETPSDLVAAPLRSDPTGRRPSCSVGVRGKKKKKQKKRKETGKKRRKRKRNNNNNNNE